MSDWKGIVKHGWHPEKEGTTFKGQVSGLFGRGDKQNTSSHATRPVSELRDPSSFGPPPKRNPNVSLSPPPSSTALQTDTPSIPVWQHDQQVDGVSGIQPKPWKIDSTGLSTSHLPPPPSRRDGADASRINTPPPPYSAAVKPSPGGPPSLPPRLPPRRPPSIASASSPQTPASQQPEYVNQATVNRLGRAGISVPALGTGKRPILQVPPVATPGTSSTSASSLQAPLPSTPYQGTTWAQKQAALRTASTFHKDPSSVSLSDAKTAASTANNFRERHGEQIAGGLSAANRLGQRFGVTENVKAGFGNGSSNVHSEGLNSPGSKPATTTTGGFSQVANIASTLGKKKPPPPPPPKKTALSGTVSVGEEAPPPVPLVTRPKFYHGTYE